VLKLLNAFVPAPKLTTKFTLLSIIVGQPSYMLSQMQPSRFNYFRNTVRVQSVPIILPSLYTSPHILVRGQIIEVLHVKSPTLRGSYPWTTNYWTEDGSASVHVCHFDPMSHSFTLPTPSAFTPCLSQVLKHAGYSFLSSVTALKMCCPCCTREWKAQS
jgi:hypothetical protein